jgi:VanZ family protein
LVAAILWLSLTPKPPDVGTGDKLSHFAAYGVLMAWFAFLYRPTRTRAMYAAGFVAMGVAIELLQPYTGRHFEPADMVANTVGVLIGWGIALLVGVRSRS